MRKRLLYEIIPTAGDIILSMHPKIEAKITLVLREQDVALLLKAVEQFNPENQAEARNRAYLLEVLEQLVLK